MFNPVDAYFEGNEGGQIECSFLKCCFWHFPSDALVQMAIINLGLKIGAILMGNFPLDCSRS
jgi:hypothetical protein